MDAELGGDDSGERGLAETGRAVEQHVIHRLAALFRGLDRDGEILLDLRLAREVGQPRRGAARPRTAARLL